jgi:hypothetical protein
MTEAEYDFEPHFTYSLKLVKEHVFVEASQALCRQCNHSLSSYHDACSVRCLAGHCDTLDQLIGRLTGWPTTD